MPSFRAVVRRSRNKLLRSWAIIIIKLQEFNREAIGTGLRGQCPEEKYATVDLGQKKKKKKTVLIGYLALPRNITESCTSNATVVRKAVSQKSIVDIKLQCSDSSIDYLVLLNKNHLSLPLAICTGRTSGSPGSVRRV